MDPKSNAKLSQIMKGLGLEAPRARPVAPKYLDHTTTIEPRFTVEQVREVFEYARRLTTVAPIRFERPKRLAVEELEASARLIIGLSSKAPGSAMKVVVLKPRGGSEIASSIFDELDPKKGGE